MSNSNVKLQLGDIIEITAPSDNDLDKKTFYISYIDLEKIRIESGDGIEKILTLTEGKLDNESIESISIKSRAEEEGYARQNNLLMNVWVDIYFEGDLPMTLTGKITNLEEDKIEITTFPTNDVIFIDFAYKGIPEELPINKIQIRRSPDINTGEAALGEVEPGEAAPSEAAPSEAEPSEAAPSEVAPGEELGEAPGDAPAIRRNAADQQLPEIPEDETLGTENQSQIDAQNKTYIFNADQIRFGSDLEEITHFVDVPEEEQRYDVEKQLDDFLDDMLSTIPNAQRTNLVKNNIHQMIQRFKELRETYSVFDDKGYAIMPKEHGANYKPLVPVLEKLDQPLYWVLPVVKYIKKIYDDAANEEDDQGMGEMGADDIEIVTLEETQAEILNILERYASNDTLNDKNKYIFLQKELNAYSTPFKPPQETEDVMTKIDVNANIVAVVENQDDFTSSVNGANAKTKRFALQTYNTGTTGLEVIKVRGENPLIKRNKITPSDSLYVKSIITLPEQTVRFSQINLPTANMLRKANLNMHFLSYWQILKAKTSVTTTSIKDFTSPVDYGKESFLKKVRNFKIDQDLLTAERETEGGSSSTSSSNAMYNNFLNTVIPNTHNLFNLMKPHLHGKLSIDNFLSYLEPFMIYHDNINYTQYAEMTEYLRDKISDFKKNYVSKAKEYGTMRNTAEVLLPSLIKVFDDSPALKDKVLSAYGFTSTIMRMSNSEFIKRIVEIDGGSFYNNAISIISTGLMIADGSRDMVNIDNYLNKVASSDAEVSKTKGKATNTAKATKVAKAGKTVTFGEDVVASADQAQCNKLKTIARRYIELDELNEDNGKDIYFDRRYDTTPYEIGDKFKTDDSMELNDRIKFYVDKIIKTIGVFGKDAERGAKAIIMRKRLVEDGDYAILETTDEDSAMMQYYVRQGNQWNLDETIDSEMITDNAKMFCNLNEKCLEVKGDCQDQATGAAEIKKYNLKLLLQEFNTTLNVTKDIVTTQIESALNNSDARIEGLINLHKLQKYKNDLTKTALGNTVEERVIIVSPYAKLRDTILSQNDLAKRYYDVTKFVQTFTRDPNLEQEESKYWFYCIKTNTKLFPTFIYDLAKTFLSGRNFSYMLDRICKEQGTISEDGDKWVDKYSGYTIKMIELNEGDEYNDQGFKVITHELIESDIEATLAAAAGNEAAVNAAAAGKTTAAPTGKRKFTTTDAKHIYTVIDTMSSSMGIQIDDQHDFIVRNVLQHLSDPSVMPPKAKYERQVGLAAAKNIIMDTYENAYNAILIYFTLAYLLIAIQTSIPPIKTKTTFPGCKKSFSGFPVDDVGDNMKGLNYMSCVAYKIKGSKGLPWSGIAKFNAKYITKQLEVNITKFILPRDEIQNKVKELKLYLSANPDLSSIPAEHSVSKWVHFYPPLSDLKMPTMQDIGDVFKTNLLTSIQKGEAVQHVHISELQSKIFLYSLNIIELIQNAVKGEALLMKNSAGEPFIENACCNNENSKNTLQYFINKVPDIAVYNNKVVRLSDMYYDIKTIGKPAILYDARNMKRKITSLDAGFSEETIYRAFIVYCRFNTLVPINEDLKAICPTKPDSFNLNDTLQESIRKLKSGARNYSEDSLQQLLGVINNSSKQPITPLDVDVTTANKLTEILTKMEEEANVKPNINIFRTSFLRVLEDFEIGSLLEDTDQMRELKNTLATVNDEMQQTVMEFVGNYGSKIKNATMKQFKECFGRVTEFTETGDGIFIGKSAETNYKMVNFMKKTMRNITKVLPNIIINRVNYGNDDLNTNDEENPAGIGIVARNPLSIPAHWKLSQWHRNDIRGIINKHYSALNAFYGDGQISLLMEKFMPIVKNMEMLAQNTLFYTPVEMQTGKGKGNSPTETGSKDKERQQEQGVKYSVFDLDLTALLFRFYFLSVFIDLISMQNNEDILQMPLMSRQGQNEEDEEEDLYIDTTINSDILEGNKSGLAEKITKIIITFTTMVCNDKNTLNYNYKALMEVINRSREKEKDTITDFFKNLTPDENEVEKIFKQNKLERWSKGNRIHTYDTKTYDEERAEMEQNELRGARMANNPNAVNLGNNQNIGAMDALEEELTDQTIDHEDNAITYMGEDAEYEDYDMDGDEMY
jgi:hypothetical protein